MSAQHSSGDLAASRRDDLRTLGLMPGASPDDVLQAYLKLRRALRADSVALRTAASEDERRAMLQRVEEAYLRLCAQAGQPALPPAFSRTIADRLAAEAAVSGPAKRPHPGAAADSAAGPMRPGVPIQGSEPAPDLRSRPSPFRARPSLPLH